MSEHLSQEQIELFLQDRLSADESLEALLHFEDCQPCADLVPSQTPQEIMEIFFPNEVDEMADELEETIFVTK